MYNVFEPIGEVLAELTDTEYDSSLPASPKASLAVSVTLPPDGRILEALGLSDTPIRVSRPNKYPTTFIKGGALDESTLQGLCEVINTLPLQGAEFQNIVKFTPSGEIVFEMQVTTPPSEEESRNEYGGF